MYIINKNMQVCNTIVLFDTNYLSSDISNIHMYSIAWVKKFVISFSDAKVVLELE